MTRPQDALPSLIERIRHDLVGLMMPRALEALGDVVRRLEQGYISALVAIDVLPSEELTLRKRSRTRTVLRVGRLATIETLASFDFFSQPSLDRDRTLTLAQLGVVERGKVVHFLGRPGTGKGRLAVALGVEAVKAGKSVCFCALADLIAGLAQEYVDRAREGISSLSTSRTSAASPSAPVRKSTCWVATITRTAPDGPITTSPSAPVLPPRSSRRSSSILPAPQHRRSRFVTKAVRQWIVEVIAKPASIGPFSHRGSLIRS